MQVHLGTGFAWLERVDVTGSMIGPRYLQVVQSFSLDIEWDVKKLQGQFQQPLAIGRGSQKTIGKITFAGVDGRLLADTIFGVTAATGQTAVARDEAATVPNLTPWTVTVANAATFFLDQGVRYAASGALLVRVASGPTAGQYSVNPTTGVYTFATADANAAVLISYEYNVTTTGLQTTMKNQLLGQTPQFRLVFTNPISPGPPGAGGQSLPIGLQLNACTANKFSMPYKQDDWMLQDLDFEAFADSGNNLGYLSTVQ